jgi:hypothetical protein
VDYELPPPDLDEHGDAVREWLAEPRTTAAGGPTR